MDDIFIKQKDLDALESIIREVFPKSVIWAYGSRVGGDCHEGSDLDLVVKDFGQENAFLFELKDKLEESNIPFLIDVFEFDRLPKSFQEEILKKYVVLYDGKKGYFLH